MAGNEAVPLEPRIAEDIKVEEHASDEGPRVSFDQVHIRSPVSCRTKVDVQIQFGTEVHVRFTIGQ
jgi:hypothetical protein